MRKTFPLTDSKHKPERVLEAVKHEVRKYFKRERRKELPEGADRWAFDCAVGLNGPERSVRPSEVIPAIDAAAKDGWATVYVEILAKPGERVSSDSGARAVGDPPPD